MTLTRSDDVESILRVILSHFDLSLHRAMKDGDA